MKISPQQKSKLVSIYPELSSWFDAKDSISTSMADALLVALLGKIKELKGDKGDIPVKGVDYWTPQELNQVINFILQKATPRKGVDYNDGEKGDSYILTPSDKKEIANSIDVPIVEKIIDRIETIREVIPKSIDVSVIKGAVSKKELESTTKKIQDGMARVDGRIKLIDQRWHGAGLSQVSHDTSLTGTGAGSSPLSVVGQTVTVSATAPQNPYLNQLWYDIS
jgi:hypothetical protein